MYTHIYDICRKRIANLCIYGKKSSESNLVINVMGKINEIYIPTWSDYSWMILLNFPAICDISEIFLWCNKKNNKIIIKMR